LTEVPELVGKQCHRCAAAATWERLPDSTRTAIDDAIRRGNIPGIVAMRAAEPPIHLPHAMDVLVFRHSAGVHRDTG
jgi:hypothetical protein